MEACIVYCTVPNEFSANLIANSLVEDKLAACVNVVRNITSIYRWEGIVQEEQELLLIIKTTESKFEALKDRIVSLHEYSVPEIISLPVKAGNLEYLNWIERETDGD